MSTLYDGLGNPIIIGGGTGTGASADTIQKVTTQVKFEDFKSSGWYEIPSTWYELILSTFKLATDYSMPYGGFSSRQKTGISPGPFIRTHSA